MRGQMPHPDDDFLDWLLQVNSDPDADPDSDDDESPGVCDEMSHWDLGEPTLEDGLDDEEDEAWP